MKTVKELIEELQKFSPDTPVTVTWEGLIQEFSLYLSADGILLIDADDENYKEKWQTEGTKAEVEN